LFLSGRKENPREFELGPHDVPPLVQGSEKGGERSSLERDVRIGE
jgi:hypothetical protein